MSENQDQKRAEYWHLSRNIVTGVHFVVRKFTFQKLLENLDNFLSSLYLKSAPFQTGVGEGWGWGAHKKSAPSSYFATMLQEKLGFPL